MARVLFYDIETAPIIGTTWGKYEQNLIWTIRDWYMLMFAYKWQGEKKTHVVALPDFDLYKQNPANDYELIRVLHGLFNEADIVVAHNGDSFDQKKSNARFIFHGLPPVPPYQQIDTKKVAKRYFNFTSNKLDDLGTYFKVGNKIHTDKELWRGCMTGDMKAWNDMKRYNKQDVILLEKVYDRMMPWMTARPNKAAIDGNIGACPNCGEEGPFIKVKNRVTASGIHKTQVQCKNCNAYSTHRRTEKAERTKYV